MLARAEFHAADLQWWIARYMECRPIGKATDYDASTKEHVLKLKLVKPIPVMLNGIAADAIHNLRAVLDHAGYAAAVAAGAGGKVGRKTHFPAGDTEGEVRGCRSGKGGLSDEIPEKIFDVMVAFKPYKGGDNFLWALNKLCNANKHRILSAAGVVIGEFTPGDLILESDGPGRFPMNPIWDSEKDEMEIGRFGGTIGTFQYNVEIASSVSFSEPQAVEGIPADTLVEHLVGKVKSILMAIEAEGRRIKLWV
jgi:hypothetical protein